MHIDIRGGDIMSLMQGSMKKAKKEKKRRSLIPNLIQPSCPCLYCSETVTCQELQPFSPFSVLFKYWYSLVL